MNSPQMSNRRVVLLTVAIMFLLVLISGGMGVFILSDTGLRQAISWGRVATEIETMYPGQLDWEVLLESAMDNMFGKLDRYSSYVEPEQFNIMDEELSGGYGGIGVTVVQHNQGLLIMSVRETGPAREAGLLAGDIILAADSISLDDLTVDGATHLLRGEEGSQTTLVVLRPVSDDTLSVTVTRRRIDFLHVPFAGFTPDSVIYIRLLDFDAGAAEDVRDALDSLLTKENSTARGVILDVRDNPGGLLSEAYNMADLFLDAGHFIVGTDARSRWNEDKLYSTGEDITGGLPVAVIVDRGSASAAEIVAGALKQLDRAILVGDTTFGKGLVQGFTRFPDGSGLRLTISRYYLEGGMYLNEFDSTLVDTGRGLVPDHYFRFLERHEFPRTLENSLLLQQFANINQDEITSISNLFGLSDQWVERFKEYAERGGFRFVSRITRRAQLLVDMSYADRANMKTIKTAQSFLRRSKVEDKRQFRIYADYIKMRLEQIAYERKYGTYRAYSDVIVRQRPEIQLAARLLMEKSQ